MEEKPRVKELGKYQYEWLNKYGSIDLRKWRLMFIHKKMDKPEWLYVGEWEPDPSNVDGSYIQRYSNLEKNLYYYWNSK